jgi:hypothetical protein
VSGDLTTAELTMLIGPAEGAPAEAIAAKAMHRAPAALDLNLLRMPISYSKEATRAISVHLGRNQSRKVKGGCRLLIESAHIA